MARLHYAQFVARHARMKLAHGIHFTRAWAMHVTERNSYV